MEARTSPDDERRFILDAIVSYADACTLPGLTPTCPYYELTKHGPICGEQCRIVAAVHGAPTRRVREAQIDGLIMTGREMPMRAVSGLTPYDAGQRFVQERSLDPRRQSTASLLLGLRAAMRPPILDSSPSGDARALLLWSELERREVSVESVVRGALLRDLAFPLVIRASAPEVVRVGATPLDVSEAFKQQLVALDGRGWCAVLDATFDSFADPAAAMTAAMRNPYNGLRSAQREDIDRLYSLIERPNAELVSRVASNAKILVAFSQLFAGRVEEWLSRLLEESVTDLLAGTAPPPSVFLALPAPRNTRDEAGLWIWERLTQTHVDQWSTSSLLLEWRYMRGEPVPNCPPRVIAERELEIDFITELTLERLANRRPQSSPRQGLEAISFAKVAAQHLRKGEWQQAANVFAGLVDLRPADGDALNNLGFCMLPFDPPGGLEYLEKATLYAREDPAVNVANRMLALHLQGRDDEALAVSRSAPNASGSVKRAFLWRHATRSGPLTLDEDVLPGEYIRDLVSHLEHGECPE
jgi:hypothetical protein